jgi:hypothetical protein
MFTCILLGSLLGALVVTDNSTARGTVNWWRD